MQLSIEQRTFIVEVFFASNDIATVRNRFRERFHDRQPPCINSIKKIVKKFQQHGTVENLNALKSGRNRTIRIGEVIDRVEDALHNNPQMSSRRNGLGLSKSSFNNITRLDLNFHP